MDALPQTNFVITDEYKKALDLANFTRQNILIHGPAGVGKSSWLRLFMTTTQKNVAVIAPTGIAAVNVGGVTIHSFFKFPPRTLTDSDIKYVKNSMYDDIDTLVIDEASMVRVDVIDRIDQFLRKNRKIELPFGGIQILLISDLLQLAPIVQNPDELEDYPSEYFFHAKVWKKAPLTTINFTHIFRQQDEKFIGILTRMREGTTTDEDIQLLNSNKADTKEIEDRSTFLCSTNAAVNSINNLRLSEIDEPAMSYQMIKKGTPTNLAGYIPETLVLKKGCKVMMLNNDAAGRWKNGTIGHVTTCDKNQVVVNVGGKDWKVGKHVWECNKYRAVKGKIETQKVGSVEQYPVKVAYAISCHKSQGQTFDSVIINFGQGAFAPGQAYTAISRCRRLEGVYFRPPLKRSDIYFDINVLDFLQNGVQKDDE